MRKCLVLAALGVLALGGPLRAQTLTRTLEWTHEQDALAAVTGYKFTVTIDAMPPTAVVPVCQSAAPNVTCRTPITLTPGNHTITVTASNGANALSGSFDYTPVTAPAKITITIQITVP